MHDPCIVDFMAQTRLKTKRRHVKRLLPGLLATFVAASAIALGSGNGPENDEDGAPQEIHMAMAVAPAGGASAEETNSEQAGGATPTGSASSQSQSGAPQGQQSSLGSGAGDAEGAGGSDGFLPNGENGLMLLADYAAGKSDPIGQGDAPGAGDGPTGGEGLPGAEPFQVAQNDASDRGLGFGFGMGGAGGGGGGGAAGGSGGGGGSAGGAGGAGSAGGEEGEPGGTGSKPSPEGGAPPVQTVVPDLPAGPTCEMTNSCEQPPKGPFTPPINSLVPVDNPEDPRGSEPHGPGAVVPEPASWLMMIMGFAGLGSVLRARRRRGVLA